MHCWQSPFQKTSVLRPQAFKSRAGQFKRKIIGQRFEPALHTKEIQVKHSQMRRSLASLASLLSKEVQMNPPRKVITSTAERLGLNVLKEWILARIQSSGFSLCWLERETEQTPQKKTVKNSHLLHTYLLEQNSTTTFLLIDPNTHDVTQVSISRAVNEYTALPAQLQ